MLCIMTNKTLRLRPERIQELMGLRGWDVGILAYKSGVKANSIYKYLNGSRELQSSITNLAMIAKSLNCSIEYLIGMTDAPTPQSLTALTTAQQEIVRHVGDLSERRQRDLAAYIRLLLEMDEQDNQWMKHNLDTNKKLLGIIDLIGGEDAFFDLINDLGSDSDSPNNKNKRGDTE